MKKAYETPLAELVEFQYKDQVVAASAQCGTGQTNQVDEGSGSWCDTDGWRTA